MILDEVLSKLANAGLRLRKEKCSFMTPSVQYLGHVIDEKGLHPMPEKVKAIKEAPAPRNVTELKSYLGLLTYYGKFLPALSTTLAPLYDLLRKDTQWRWTQTEKSAFENCKDLLMSSQVLCHYNPTKELILSCDASPYGIGAVLAHKMEDGSEQPTGFASRTLSNAEKNYAQIEKEGLACVFGIKKFHSYLYGRHFTLFTDHKPLLGLFNKGRAIPPQASARIQRWALTLAMYEYNLKFKPTDAHANADAMSRLPLPETIKSNPVPPETVLELNILDQCPVTSSQVRKSTRRDPTLSKILGYVKCVWPEQRNEALKPYYQRRNELSVEDGCLLWGNRVIIPPLLCKPILEELHDCHVGGSRMKSFARGFVWWPNLDSEIEKLVKECLVCQESRPNPPKAPLHSWPQPNRPWSRIHIDFAGPFMGHMLLVIVDAYSKWIEVHVLNNSTTKSTIQNLRKTFSQLGVPEMIVSDNGSCFTSSEFKTFCEMNGIRHVTTAPYHPASNGLAERAV
ncbi:hypothetical protein BSL78_14238 [Apostichopus japonicus]|uniref:Integrase catalytic domain-containing protein n=1 Tax=Stichopus japonicus TaxID=307972 RepID=A0A2G8KLL8_STIJA|nr:hypothetical protein BSL78_14238 [Apostichopus japonicus]